MILTLSQKMIALNCLNPCSITYSTLTPADPWRCSVEGLEIEEKSILRSVYGIGPSPEEAVNNLWDKLTDNLDANSFIVIDAYKPTRRQYVWAGFMWQPVPVMDRDKEQFNKVAGEFVT